jgi:hypothetical protein
MASIGKAEMDLVIRQRWDATDPLTAVAFWTLMTALGCIIGYVLGQVV